jgi:hypothetical protein
VRKILFFSWKFVIEFVHAYNRARGAAYIITVPSYKKKRPKSKGLRKIEERGESPPCPHVLGII